MGAVANAVTLMRDDTFRDYITAVCGYTARLVIIEAGSVPEHAVRLTLAAKVIGNPQHIVDRAINAVATNPAVAMKGVTVGDGKAISEADLIAEVGSVWTHLAKLDAGIL